MKRHLLATCIALCAAPCAAAVYEVGDDGTMVRVDPPPPPRPASYSAIPRREPRQTTSARAGQFRPAVVSAGAQYAVSPALIDAIAHVESRYNPAAVSRVRATGIMQLMPGTARELGVDPRDPAANIRGGTAYLRMLLNRFDGDVVRTIAAYNAGPNAVARAGGVPNYPETRAYVAAVLGRLSGAAQ